MKNQNIPYAAALVGAGLAVLAPALVTSLPPLVIGGALGYAFGLLLMLRGKIVL